MGVEFLYFFAFSFGAIVGSFSNVCILRLPEKKSVSLPPSHCPICGKNIKWYDNIPIVSWIFLRAKCRSCGTQISSVYPIIEAISGLIYIFNLFYWGPTSYFFLYSLLCSAFLILAVIDYRHKILPDVITLPGIVIGFLSSFLLGQISIYDSIIGFLLGGGGFFLIAIVSRGGMGGGDIKLMGMIGAFMGWQAVLLTTFIGSSVGSVVGGGLMLLGKKGRKDQIPFGPFLVLAATVSLFWGDAILNWYFDLTYTLQSR